MFGREQPLPGFGQLRLYGFVGGLLLRFRLARLVRIQIERFPLVQDRLPGKVQTHRRVKVLQAHPVRRKEHERVAVEPGRIAAHFENGPGGLNGVAVLLLVVRMLRGQHDETSIRVVGHVRGGARQGVYARETAPVSQHIAQALFQFGVHFVRVALEFSSAVLRQLGHRRLGRVPYPRAVLIQVGGLLRKMTERVAEYGGRFSGHHATEFYPPVFQAPLRRVRGGSRSEEDGAGNPPRGGQFAEVRAFCVDSERQRIRPVYILLDDRDPVVRQIAGQFGTYADVVHGYHGRQNKRIAVARRPQGVNDRRHEAQHPARTLEFQQGGPVVVQPVENFGMDGIGGLDAFFVVRFAAFGRKFAALASVQVRKGPRRYVAQCECIGAAQRFEQAPAHDFEAFLGACRAPCRLEAPDDVTEPVQRFAAP